MLTVYCRGTWPYTENHTVMCLHIEVSHARMAFRVNSQYSLMLPTSLGLVRPLCYPYFDMFLLAICLPSLIGRLAIDKSEPTVIGFHTYQFSNTVIWSKYGWLAQLIRPVNSLQSYRYGANAFCVLTRLSTIESKCV